jgi:hypothetical protein
MIKNENKHIMNNIPGKSLTYVVKNVMSRSAAAEQRELRVYPASISNTYIIMRPSRGFTNITD